jgi:hypothetical protein
VTTYLIRIIIPINRFVASFPTISYPLKYLSFFIIGTVAIRHNWFRNIPKSMGNVDFILALVATIILFRLRSSAEAQISLALDRGSQRSMRCGTQPLRWERPSDLSLSSVTGSTGRAGSADSYIATHTPFMSSKPQSSYSLPLR